MKTVQQQKLVPLDPEFDQFMFSIDFDILQFMQRQLNSRRDKEPSYGVEDYLDDVISEINSKRERSPGYNLWDYYLEHRTFE